MDADFANWAHTAFNALWRLANSSFFISLSGALAGAAGGAIGAQHLLDRQKQREIATAEFRASSVAMLICLDLFNACLSLKSQHLQDLKTSFDQDSKAFSVFRERLDNDPINSGRFEKLIDFRTLPTLDWPSEGIRTLALEKITLPPKPILLVLALTKAFQSLNSFIQERNILIEDFRNNPNADPVRRFEALYGHPDSSGNKDERYSSVLNAIYMMNDDCIFFSKNLIEELERHASSINETGRLKQRVHKPELHNARTAALLPDENNYATWKDVVYSSDKN